MHLLVVRYVTSRGANNRRTADSAFLKSNPKEETILMEQPEGYVNDTTKVCKLRKALCGLKQSWRTWNRQLETMRKCELSCFRVDLCPITRKEMMFVTIYVDDLFIFTNKWNLKEKLKKFLNSCFQIKNFGETKLCLDWGVLVTARKAYYSSASHNTFNKFLSGSTRTTVDLRQHLWIPDNNWMADYLHIPKGRFRRYRTPLYTDSGDADPM